MSTVVPADAAGVSRAVAELRAGRLVAFPTETVYGLGALARDPAAVGEIYRAKGRPSGHPLIIHLPSSESLPSWLDPVPEAAGRLAAAFWPGPLTLVARRAATVPDVVTGGQSTVAVRRPAHPVAAALLAALGDGVAAPSANRFGRISPTTAEHVADEFQDSELLILDGGPCTVGVESTILDLSGESPRLLRPGAVSRAQLEEVLGRQVEVPDGRDATTPAVPGSLQLHYAPRARVRLVAPADLQREVDTDAALLLRSAPEPDGCRGPAVRLPADPAGYARALYAALRRLDAAAPAEIVIERPPEGEAWSAVLDRLTRAAGPRGTNLRSPESEERT